MRAETWTRVAAMAQEQHGLVTAQQLQSIGVASSSVKHAVSTGVLTVVRKGVYLVAGVPASVYQPLAAAVLAAPIGSGASFLGAAWLHGSQRAVPGRVELTIPAYSHRRLDGALVHRSALWLPEDTSTVNGILATTPARTLADLALGMNPWTVGRIFDEFIRLGRVDSAEVLAMLARLGRRHRGGSVILQQMAVNRLDIAKGITDLESSVFRALERRGVPKPSAQVQIAVPGDLFVVDWAWVAQKVALETHGRVVHAQYETVTRDANRRVKLRAVGWDLFEAVSGMDLDALANSIQGALEANGLARKSPPTR